MKKPPVNKLTRNINKNQKVSEFYTEFK